MELAFTPNNFSKLDEVQEAVKTILSLKPEFIIPHPFDHARTIIDTNFKPEFKIEEDLVFGFLRVILNHPKDGLLENKFKEQLSAFSTTRKENSVEWSDFLNEFKPSPDVAWVFKKYYSDDWEQTKFKEWFVFQLNQLSDNTYSTEAIDWKNFEFYETIYKRYHRNLLTSKMKADANDDNDLKNMIYVQPTDLYWTLEKRWLAIAKEGKIDKYLYIE